LTVTIIGLKLQDSTICGFESSGHILNEMC